MENLGLENQILSVTDRFPTKERFSYDVEQEQQRLEVLRQESKQYLINALKDA